MRGTMHMDTDEDQWRNSNGQGTNDKSIDQYDQDTDTMLLVNMRMNKVQLIGGTDSYKYIALRAMKEEERKSFA